MICYILLYLLLENPSPWRIYIVFLTNILFIISTLLWSFRIIWVWRRLKISIIFSFILLGCIHLLIAKLASKRITVFSFSSFVVRRLKILTIIFCLFRFSKQLLIILHSFLRLRQFLIGISNLSKNFFGLLIGKIAHGIDVLSGWYFRTLDLYASFIYFCVALGLTPSTW